LKKLKSKILNTCDTAFYRPGRRVSPPL